MVQDLAYGVANGVLFKPRQSLLPIATTSTRFDEMHRPLGWASTSRRPASRMTVTSCSRFENRAFAMTCLRTRSVSSAAAREPTTCLDEAMGVKAEQSTLRVALTAASASARGLPRIGSPGRCEIRRPWRRVDCACVCDVALLGASDATAIMDGFGGVGRSES